MSSQVLILICLLLPLFATPILKVVGNYPNLREGVTLLTSVALFATVLELLARVNMGMVPELTLIEMLPGVPIAFKIEPLGMVFAMVASGLWIVNSVYSIGYMRGHNEDNQTRFYMCFTIAISAAMGIAFAGNLLTLFIFYEVLTLSTYPLVTHKGTDDAKRGGRIYLGILIGTSVGFFLLAIMWTYVMTGTLDFTKGGFLAGKADGIAVPVLLALYMFGVGKAALMPFHKWLPSAMVAPTPVSALLHAVAVVKAGVFSVLKIAIYVFGLDFLQTTGATNWLLWAASFTLLTASMIAMTKDNLKARLAYSTISQLAYVVLGVALASSMGLMGGALQIPMHAFGKITLFFCAGAIYVAAHKTEVSELNGLGRKMPFTFAAFFIGSISIIGLPPMGGAWAKWYLVMGAIDANQLFAVGVLLASSLLNIAYLMPIPIRGFFMSEPKWKSDADQLSGEVERFEWGAIKEAPLFCVIPICFTALGCIVLFFKADVIYKFLEPIVLP
jgi:multicomponent Na+:H+ antiporter subunit D